MTKRNDYQPQTSLVPPSGYVWDIAWTTDRQGRQQGQGRLLVLDNPGDELSPVEVSDNLFAGFSRLEVCEKSVLQFANGNGWLGLPTLGHPVVYSSQKKTGTLLGGMNLKFGDQPSLVGERLEDWTWEVAGMRRAVDLANALEDKDLYRVETWIRISPPWIAPAGDHRYDEEVWAPDVKEGQIRKAGRRLLQNMINRALQERTQIGIDLDNDLPRQKVIANNLLGVMWLQLLDSVTKGTMGSCEVCSGLLVLSARTGRAHRNDRKTCSSACRQKLRRQVQAASV